jgi:hypothetical protein
MKKVTLMMFVALIGVLSANAQFYLGGSLSLDMETTKPEGGKKTDQTTFSIVPEFGYQLNQDLDLGITGIFSNEKDPDGNKSTGWGLAPYARYSFVEFGRFSVWGQAGIFIGGAEADKTKLKSTTFGLTISPVLKYSLSGNVDLITGLNFFNVAFSQTAFKLDGKKQNTVTSFGLGANTNDVATLGNISIGFAYKF